MRPTSLEELEDDLARDLSMIDYPNTAWVAPAAEGVLDVLIVGGGQGGLAVASKLLREQIRNIQVVDECSNGQEGIWMRYARMQTLRTPKHIGGPDLGVSSLTFQAWFEAQNGRDKFNSINYISKSDWQNYLAWFKKVLKIPVKNNAKFMNVSPKNGLLSVTIDHLGRLETIKTRKLVLAGGIETSGYWWMPPEIEQLPSRLRAHTAETIDFERLRGKTAIVVGAGASAFDNAATALEHGASVTMLCRRSELQRVQPYKVLAFPGFLNDFASLPDAARWRSMNYLLTVREALTAETWARTTCHSRFELVTGAPVTAAASIGDAVVLETPRGRYEADFVICGTGFEMDLSRRPELASVFPHIATWADRFTPPDDQLNPRLGRYPYLDAGMSFTEKNPGEAPWVGNIFNFNFGATMSFGPSGSSISAMKYAAPRIASAIVGSLFREDYPYHEERIRGYDTPEFDLVYARNLAPES